VGVARLAAAAGQAGRAARLLAAADAIRGSSRRPWSSVDLPDHERVTAVLRVAGPPAALQAAAAEGQATTVDRAVADALETLDALDVAATPAAWTPPAAVAPTRAGAEPAGAPPRLTAREREVAALVRRGLTNRQIAARLIVTTRAVDAHVAHLLRKLGFATRAQVG
jgi:non-specific serine/threonine protein kinase